MALFVYKYHMNFDSFSHGQIKSKLWLCEELEKYIPKNSNVKILGSWYNILAFMLLTRNPNNYKSIEGIDINPDVQSIADKICNYWIAENQSVTNTLGDANNVEYSDTQVVINCSPEHMDNTDWYKKVPEGTVVCIQSISIHDPLYPWLITTPHYGVEDMKTKYPMSAINYSGQIRIDYGSWGYDRYMLIGIK
jgi:hypothetical protein